MARLPPEEYSEERHTAIHEAGHAIAHLAIAWPFELVTILPGPDYAGQVCRLPDAPCPSEKVCALVDVSGSIAVDLWLQGRWVWRDALYSDWAVARLRLLPQRQPAVPSTPEQKERFKDLLTRVSEYKLASVFALLSEAEWPEDTPLVDRLLTRAARTAQGLLRRQWPRLVRIADALQAVKTLTYAEALRLYRP